jgi:hypothetical protein
VRKALGQFMNYEETLVKTFIAFVVPDKRERYLRSADTAGARRVLPLQGLRFFPAYPALPRWANSCRASGAGVSMHC